MSDQSEVIKKYLSSHNIGEVVTSSPHKAMITIQATDTVETALEVFRKFNILSAPVLKADEDKKEGETPFLGIVNILDLLIAAIFQPLFDKLDTEEKISEAKEEELESLLDSKETAFQKPVKEALGKSDESKTLPIFDAKDSLTKLMEAFSVGVHRVIVKSIGEDGKESYSYISQTDVVRSLRKVALDSGAKVGGILTNTIAELKLNSKSVKVLTIPSSTRALIGFRSMLSQRKQVSAVPVTDASSGALVETLSASDFRGVRHDSLRLLLLSVTEFLKLSRAKPRQAIAAHKNLVCSGSEVFGDVIQRIVSSGVHRLWIVNDDEAPTGVISLTDVIRQFTSHAAVPTTAVDPTTTTTTTASSPSTVTDASAS